MGALLLQHFCQTELFVLGMAQFAPQRPATFAQPRIEFGERAKSLTLRIQPDAPTAILDVLLYHPLFPTGGYVAEVGVKQVVGAHHGKTRIDDSTLALVDPVDGCLHVVVNAAPGNAAQCGKGARVGVEQHFVAVARVGYQPERTAGAQLEVRYLQASVDAANDQALFAPVELERLAQLELQRHKGTWSLACTPSPVADESSELAVATLIAFRFDLRKHILGSAPVLLGTVGVGLEGLLKHLVKCGKFAGFRFPAVRWYRRTHGASKPYAYRVARQTRALCYFMQRQFVA